MEFFFSNQQEKNEFLSCVIPQKFPQNYGEVPFFKPATPYQSKICVLLRIN